MLMAVVFNVDCNLLLRKLAKTIFCILCLSLQRCSTRNEASTIAGNYRRKLPPLVAAVGKELLNHSTLQKVSVHYLYKTL